MSDLVFRQGIDSSFGGLSFTKTSSNTIEFGSAVGGVGIRDAVRVVYEDGYDKALYGVCTNASVCEITFDDNIYPLALNSSTGVTLELFNEPEILAVEAYRINTDVQNGLFSKAYRTYSSNLSHTLIIPEKKNEFFGLVSVLATNDNVIFVDNCDSKAYKVGFTEGSFDNLNNRFRSSLEFNIATR